MIIRYWTIFYGLLDYDSTVATIYTGDAAGLGYLAPNQSTECACVPPAVPQAGCLTGLLYNCGFENALGDEWVLHSGTGTLTRKTGVNAHDGTYGLGFSASEQTVWFKQSFVADADYTHIAVNFWARATTGLVIIVDGQTVFTQNWNQLDSIWRSYDVDEDVTISEGDVIEIRPRLHSTYSVDSFNVVLS